MGCDIHLFVEVRRQGKWAQVVHAPSGSVRPDDDSPTYGDQFYAGRNYGLFTILANVRPYGHPNLAPMSKPRGLPKDVSKEVTAISEHWNGDGHSHSHHTLNELMAYAYGETWISQRTINRLDGVTSEFQVTLEKLCEFLVEPGISPDDIRIVFWFDN